MTANWWTKQKILPSWHLTHTVDPSASTGTSCSAVVLATLHIACQTHPSRATLQPDISAGSKRHNISIQQSRGQRMIFFAKSNLQASLMVRNCRNRRHVTLSYECLDFSCHVFQWDLWWVAENFSPRTSLSPLQKLYTIRTSVSPLQKLYTIRTSVSPLQKLYTIRTSVSPLKKLYTIRTSVSPLQKLYTIRTSVSPLQKLYTIRTSVSTLQKLYIIRTSFSPLQKLYTIRTSVFPLQKIYTIRTSISPLQKPYTIRSSISPVQKPYTIRTSVSPLQMLYTIPSKSVGRGHPEVPSVILKIPRSYCKGRENIRNFVANFDPPATVWFLLLPFVIIIAIKNNVWIHSICFDIIAFPLVIFPINGTWNCNYR